MYRWKSRGGKTQRREENGREEERRSEKRKSQKKGDAGARKGRKAAIPCVFLMICGPGGSKSRLAKAAGAEPPGQMREEKLHAVVARSTPRSEHFWKLRCRKSACRCGAKHIAKSKCTNHLWKLPCRKSARRCGAKHVSKSKCTKHLSVGPLLEVEMSKRCTPLWREAHFQVKMLKTPHVRATFGRWSVVLCGRRKGFCALPKVSKMGGFCSISTNDGRHGAFQEALQRCISCGRRGTRDMFIRDVGRLGRWFPERYCILEHQIFRFAKMILRHRRSTLYDLASLFRGRRSTYTDRMEKSQNALARGRQLCTQFSIFEGSLAELLRFWCCQLPKLRKSRRIASFFDVVKLENCGCLAELLRFWCCQLRKWRKISQNSFIFNLAGR